MNNSKNSTSSISVEQTTVQNMAKLDERIGFVGGGNMAFAIGAGLIDRGTLFFHFHKY